MKAGLKHAYFLVVVATSMVLTAMQAATSGASGGACREMEVRSGGEIRLAAGAVLEMPSFDGRSVSVVLGEPSVSGGGVATYGGRVVGSTMNNVSAVSHAGGFVVTVARANGTRLTFSHAGGVWTIREFRAPRGGKCGTKKRREDAASGFRAQKAASALTGDPLVDGAAFMARGETRTNVIDVMVVVDASAAKWMKEKSSCSDFPDPVSAFCAEAVQRCNNMYANTGLDAFFTFNLVRVERVDCDFSKLRDEDGYVDSENVLTYLIGDETPSQAALKSACKSVRAARDACGADIVSCLVSCGEDEPDGTVGIGGALDDEEIRGVSFAEAAYNVCLVEAVALGNTMAHEIGHNMGAGHAEMKDKDNSGPSLYGYSTGKYFNVTNAAGDVFMHAASVMAYDDDGWADDFEYCGRWGEAGEIVTDPDSWNSGMYTETEFFSSAKHTYKYVDENGAEIDSGVLTGDALHDNTRILSLTYPVVANYRVSAAGVEDRYGPYVPGVMVSEAIPALVGYAAKGLPAGLKFDSKTGTISGTPTKPTGDAGATVTFTKKNATTVTTRIVVGALPVLKAEVVGDGKVTGAGAYAANKKVTLKATANKGNVFAGWYDNADAAAEGGGRGATLPVSRLASYVLAMPTNDVTLYAKFIAQDEDWAEVACAVEDEYATKQEIAPIAVQADGGSLPTVKVTGLPTGLKFTAKDVVNSKTKEVTAASNTIYGTPTKSGVYTTTVTVTTAGKATSSKTLTFVVRAGNEKFLKTDYDSTMGKVTGAGIYASGKKVTLKATANAAKKATKTTSAQEATVFAGWYSDEYCQYPLEGASDYRATSFVYTMPDEDTTVYAKFVPASEDTDIVLYADGTEVTTNAADTVFNTAGELTLALEAESVTVPKIALSGLPTGLKYTDKQVFNRDKSVAAEANTVYGTATKPGTYVVTAKLTNTTVKKALERKFTIVVDNLTGANDVLVCTDAGGNDVGLANACGESYTLTVGVSELSLPRKIVATSGTAKVTGLPAGLKYDAKTGTISGIATKAGTYTVYVTVGTLTSTFTVVVDPLPDWAVGTYYGTALAYGLEQDWSDLMLSTVVVGKDGKVSFSYSEVENGKALKPYVFSGQLVSANDDGYTISFDVYQRSSNDRFEGEARITPSFDLDDDIAVGVLTSTYDGTCDEDDDPFECELSAYQSVWSRKDLVLPSLKGVTASFDLEQGGSVIVKFGTAGTVSVAYYGEGQTKSSATGSGNLMLTHYVPGEGWHGVLSFLVAKANLVESMEVVVTENGVVCRPEERWNGALTSNVTGDFWGFIMTYDDVKEGDNDDYLGTVHVAVSDGGAISATVVTPKGTYEFSADGFDTMRTVRNVVYDVNAGMLMTVDDAYNVCLCDAAGDELNLSFDPDLVSTSAEPFGGSFQAKGGTKFYVNGEQRITSWTDDSSAARRLADYIGTYNIKAMKVDSDEWALKGMPTSSDLKLVVDAAGMAHLTGSLDGQKLDAYSYVYDGGWDYLWLDFAFVHKNKPIYFEFHLAPVAEQYFYYGDCWYTLFK